jgi:hypothetical protein
MITEEQAIEYAKKLKEFCSEQDSHCKGCPFKLSSNCSVGSLGYVSPCDWVLDD